MLHWLPQSSCSLGDSRLTLCREGMKGLVIITVWKNLKSCLITRSAFLLSDTQMIFWSPVSSHGSPHAGQGTHSRCINNGDGAPSRGPPKCSWNRMHRPHGSESEVLSGDLRRKGNWQTSLMSLPGLRGADSLRTHIMKEAQHENVCKSESSLLPRGSGHSNDGSWLTWVILHIARRGLRSKVIHMLLTRKKVTAHSRYSEKVANPLRDRL